MKKNIIILSTVIILISTTIILNHISDSRKNENMLSDLSYEMIVEANNDISTVPNKYRDIISADLYCKLRYYPQDLNNNDHKTKVISHSVNYPQTKISGDTAVTYYTYNLESEFNGVYNNSVNILCKIYWRCDNSKWIVYNYFEQL